jgi:hypothetical protein
MTIGNLCFLISDLGIDPTAEHLVHLLKTFNADFITHPLVIDGLNVKVVLKNSKVRGFTAYPETFVHLITRKGQRGERIFDRHRANRIHWIRSILEEKNNGEVTYFEYREGDGTMRDYYWYKEGDFLVIMEKKSPNYVIISSFVVDKENREYYEKRYQKYKAGLK